jgi:hypothetical protein
MRRFHTLLLGKTGQPPMLGPELPVGTAVAGGDAVGVALGALTAVKVRVGVEVADGIAVRVEVLVHVGVTDLVAVRVGVALLTGAFVRVGVAVRVAGAVAVRVAVRVAVGTGGFVGVRVGVAVLVTREGQNHHRFVVAAGARAALNVIDRKTTAASEGVKRRFIAISLPKIQRELCAGETSPTKSYAPQDARDSAHLLTRSPHTQPSSTSQSSAYGDLST